MWLDTLALRESKDPWKRNNRNNPPDIDELLSELGGKFNSSGGGKASPWFKYGLIFALVGLWAISGLYIVRPAENSVMLRFGRYITTLGPGLHWVAPGLEQRYIVNTNEIVVYSYASEMLTKDENYARVALTVYYRKADPYKFLFSVNDPEESLRGALQSALRQVIGHTHLEDILTSGKESARIEVTELTKQILEAYQTGLEITDIKLQEATAPIQVMPAFDNVIVAREEKAAKISQGERYVKKVIPVARGKAARIKEAAQAYAKQVVLNAKADTAKYLALLPEYEKDSELLTQRIYFESMAKVLSKTQKLFVSDPKQLLLLNVDQKNNNRIKADIRGVLSQSEPLAVSAGE